MRFRTEVDIADPGFRLDYSDRLLSLGSCFAENIASRLAGYRFRILSNPFGILYNPQSILQGLRRLERDAPFTASELTFLEGRWFSFQHHGRFDSPDRETCLERINASLRDGAARLRDARLLILTFGTAYVYERIDTGEVVANCHRLPDREFRRYRLEPSAIIEPWSELLTALRRLNPKLQVIITVSPVRHWKDGAELNGLSKATLVLAGHALRERFDFVRYFPAYELMMDDLRDYRFYEEDMIHPTKVAIDYIWSRFRQSYIDRRCDESMQALEKLAAARTHLPREVGSPAHQLFVQRQLERIDDLSRRYPDLDLSEDRRHFEVQVREPREGADASG